jgi:hypothetical protein
MHKENVKDSLKEGNEAMKTIQKYRTLDLQNPVVDGARGGLGFKSENWL